MDYKVTKGDRVATITLDGSEREVIFDSTYNVFNVKSDGDVTVSLSPGKSEGDDWVMVSRKDDPVFYPHMRKLDRVYLKGSGKALVFASDITTPVFKVMAKGGDGNTNLKAGDKFDVSTTAVSRVLRADGGESYDPTQLHNVIGYDVLPGSMVFVKATDDTNTYKYVLAVNSNLNNTSNIVAGPFTDVIDDFFIVPEGVKHIAFQVSKTDTETGVYGIKT